MRRVRLRTGLLLSLAIVVVGNAGALPAFAEDLPTTVPVLVEPADASSVAGDVPISATSTGSSVQFYLDGAAFGDLVAAVAGTASTTWPSWGAVNGSHIWTAADCKIEVGCNATLSTPVTVTLANDAPVVTSPLDGATTGTDVTLLADAPGGGIAFLVDGVPSGFDATAPYSFALTDPLEEGAHTASVVECDTAQDSCGGPASPTVNFTVKVLHPTITSVSPNPFSPHHDGRADTTSFRVKLGGPQQLSFSIRNSNNQVVQGPHNQGIVATGTHTYRWDGKTNSGKIAGDGVFTIVVNTTATSGGATFAGGTMATVRVDDSPSAFTGMTGNGSTFYPVVDRYLDQFRPKVTVNEGGGLWLEIYNKAGAKVREIAKPHAATGTFQFGWDGRTAGGSLVRAGTYRYFFKAQDRAGNRRISPNFHVNLRLEHIVGKAKKYALNGDQANILTSDPSCTNYSYNLSDYVHGVWLANVCDPVIDDFQVIVANFNFSIAGAVRYDNIHLDAIGNTVSAPEPIAALIYNWRKRDWDGVGVVSLNQNGVDLRASFGTVSGTDHVSAGRIVKVSIGVPDSNPPEDFDMAYAAIVVHYSVLAR
jgi:flagellar hook assembly protein FlgD